MGTEGAIAKEVEIGIHRYPRKVYSRERAGESDKSG